MSKIVLTVILIVIIVALVAVMVVGMGFFTFATACLPQSLQPRNISCHGVDIGGLYGGRLPQDVEHGLEYEQQASGVQRIYLDFAHENVEVVTAETDTIRVQQTSEKELAEEYQMRYGMVNGDLVAQSGMAGKWNVAALPPQSTVTVTIPANMTIPVEVDTASGTVNVNGGTYQGLRMNTASGSVNAAGVSTTELHADTASGDVRIADMACDNLDIDTVSGRVELSGTVKSEADLDSASGDISFTGAVDLFDAEAVSGTVTADIAGLREFDVDTTSGTVRLTCEDVQNLDKIDVNTISGDVRVTLPDNDGVHVDFDSISGDMQNQFGMPSGSAAEIDVETTSGNLYISKK